MACRTMVCMRTTRKQRVLRAFLDRFEAGLQVTHVGVERVVARLELLVRVALLSKLAIGFAHLQPTAFAEPHRILERDNQRDQNVGKNAHVSDQRRLKNAPRPA